MAGGSHRDITDNLLLLTDSYKVSHHRQYPPGTQVVYSYLESRGGRFDEVVFFGLQYYLERYLAGPVVRPEHIDAAEAFLAAHFNRPDLFNRAGWERIVRTHGGRLPVSIRAVPEGTPVPVRNVLLTIENTDPACFWLTNYLETLLVQLWYSCTVATLSREMKRLILSFLARTGDPSLVDFKLHDFGFRGVSSVESAAIGGAAHLVNFLGSDTLIAAVLAQRFYGAAMASASIPAAEHSTQTAWGRAHELDAYRNMLAQFPTGTVAVVSDSYDILRACRELWGGALREAVLARAGTLVIRPDSGDPSSTVLEVMNILGERFGSTTNAKGYRLLPPQVRVIQGDAIDYDEAGRVLATLAEHGWSADNITFGMGGALLQKLHRDTQQFALKCSAVVVDGVARDVHKEPRGAPEKTSKRGRLSLVRDGSGFRTVRQGEASPDVLREVFRDGEILVRQCWEDIRAHAALR
jgi:nicotinamide phosphoribosyltransferase